MQVLFINEVNLVFPESYWIALPAISRRRQRLGLPGTEFLWTFLKASGPQVSVLDLFQLHVPLTVRFIRCRTPTCTIDFI